MKRSTSTVRIAAVLAVALGATAGIYLAMKEEPQTVVQGEVPEFRCGYAAERAGIEDPACDELRRPEPPTGVRAVGPSESTETLEASARP